MKLYTKLCVGLILLLYTMPAPAAWDTCPPAGQQVADIPIPVEMRIHNRPNGQCVWAALETLGRWNELHSLDGITERAMREGWHGAGSRAVRSLLRDVQIPYEDTTNGDAELLYRGLRTGTGCLIFFPGHAVVLVGLDATEARYVDSNSPARIRRMPRASFDEAWEGYGCFLRLMKRIHDRRHPIFHPNEPGPGPSPHPSPNPDKPVEPPLPTPPPPVVPVPPVVVAPGGPTLEEIGKLLDTKLAAHNITIENRFVVIEKKLDDLTGQIRTKFVPK